MTDKHEVELKLEVEPGFEEAVIAALGLGSPTTKHLHAVYYDTPAKALREAGISLRIRRAGDRYIQTIKLASGRGAGFFDRAEWERELAGDSLDLHAIDEAGLQQVVDPVAWNALRPAFAIDVERRIWHVARFGAKVEMVLDRGSAQANDRQDIVCEFELELIEGSTAALFELAHLLTDAAPVRIGVQTKAERGYRLLEAMGDIHAKAEPLQLPGDATVAEAFAMIVQACLRHFRLNEPLISRRDAAGLHQARVALRRLRSALSLFAKVITDGRSDGLRLGLRELAGTLGEARSLDVLLESLADEQVSDDLVAHLRAAREAAYDAVIARLASAATRHLIIDMLEWSELGEWRSRRSPDAVALREQSARAFGGEVLDRHRRRLKKRGRDLATLEPEARHDVRIEAKKLRYASEFFLSLFDDKKARRRAKTFLNALEALQSSLGTLNDIATGKQMAQGLAAQGIHLPATGDADEAALLSKAEAAHDAFADARPFWR